MNRKTITVNLFGAPSSGKSTCSANLFAKMKTLGMSVELVTESAKDIIHENHMKFFEQQVWITAEQNRRQWRVAGQYDYIITDSPILLALFYTPPDYFPSYKSLVEEIFNSYTNVNFYLERMAAYDPVGRYQTEEQANDVGVRIKQYLSSRGIDHISLVADNAADKVLDILLNRGDN